MKIGLLITSIGNFGQKGFYNAQEVGLAKALDRHFDSVCVYKLVTRDIEKTEEKIVGCKNTILKYIPSKNFGINGLLDTSLLDSSLDVLVYFSDTQIVVPKVFRWAVDHKIKFYPYIGVVESHSTSKWKKWIMDLLFKRNLKVYQKCLCFVKTPIVEKRLRELGVMKTKVMPVGLDIDLLHKGYESEDRLQLRNKYGFDKSDKVLLFIGRMIDEKQPLKMLDIFERMKTQDARYKLLMVGTGPLDSVVADRIRQQGTESAIKQIKKIPNNKIWELYYIADCFVNLNQQEIFGMAILEAMYYGCKIVAWKAPGPELIIENGNSGWLVQSDEEVIECIQDNKNTTDNAHDRVLSRFTWEYTARNIAENVM